MCGIVGYIGDRNTLSVLLNGLTRLEYRGYDSAGVTFIRDGEIQLIKKKGHVSELKAEVARCGFVLDESLVNGLRMELRQMRILIRIFLWIRKFV